jgi:predicted HTH transcriptional regulator
MTPEQLARLFQQRSQVRLIHFDEQAVPETQMDNLDKELWQRFTQNSQEEEKEKEEARITLQKLKLLTLDDSGNERATVSGILMCTRHPENYLPNAYIEAVHYRGVHRDAHYQLDHARITGPLNIQIREALLFVKRNMTVSATKNPWRIEVPEFSENAVFEAIVNAVAHRDYSIYGTKIRLFMFDDRLELYSPGTLPNSVTIDSLHLRQSTRNELLTSLLARCPIEEDGIRRQYLMEKRGEGVPIILRESLTLSQKKPVYQLIDDAELLLTIYSAPLPNN